MNCKLLFFVLLASYLLSGCTAKVMNPYEESFGCPGGDVGSCDDVGTAYKKSLSKNEESFSPMVVMEDDVSSVDWGEEEPDNRTPSKLPVYNLTRKKTEEVKGIIDDPLTPILIPSKKMRLLVLGYQDTKDFYGHRYIYFIAEEERWALPFNTIGGGSSEYAESLFE